MKTYSMAFYQFEKIQLVKSSIDELWDFISNPKNLKLITPSYMGFDITTKNVPSKMYEGMIVSYKVSPLLGIKTTWVTEITKVRDKSYFVDEQRIGPYSLWHHQHILEPNSEGILMRDIVSYSPPGGFIGSILNTLVIQNKLKEIFDYRKKSMDKLFPN